MSKMWCGVFHHIKNVPFFIDDYCTHLAYLDESNKQVKFLLVNWKYEAGHVTQKSPVNNYKEKIESNFTSLVKNFISLGGGDTPGGPEDSIIAKCEMLKGVIKSPGETPIDDLS